MVRSSELLCRCRLDRLDALCTFNSKDTGRQTDERAYTDTHKQTGTQTHRRQETQTNKQTHAQTITCVTDIHARTVSHTQTHRHTHNTQTHTHIHTRRRSRCKDIQNTRRHADGRAVANSYTDMRARTRTDTQTEAGTDRHTHRQTDRQTCVQYPHTSTRYSYGRPFGGPFCCLPACKKNFLLILVQRCPLFKEEIVSTQPFDTYSRPCT